MFECHNFDPVSLYQQGKRLVCYRSPSRSQGEERRGKDLGVLRRLVQGGRPSPVWRKRGREEGPGSREREQWSNSTAEKETEIKYDDRRSPEGRRGRRERKGGGGSYVRFVPVPVKNPSTPIPTLKTDRSSRITQL